MLAPRPQSLSAPIDRYLLDDCPELVFRVEVARSVEELKSHRTAWDRLVEASLEPNAFFEPNLLIPAVRHLGGKDRPEIVLLYARQRKHHDADPVLCGLFPIVRHARYGRRRMPGVAIWLHLHAFLGTPLIRGDFPREILAGFLDWLGEHGRARAIHFPKHHGGGPFAECLATVMQQREDAWFLNRQVARAKFEPAESAEDYLMHVWARKKRQETRRLRRGLEGLGTLIVRRLSPDEDIAPWLEAFLELEASGWKGANQTAFASSEAERAYFVEALTATHHRGRLHMLSLELDGKPIAMNTAFFTGEGGYYFKIAHEEAYAKYSPGVVLEAEFLNVLHQRPGLKWVDSCADVNHPMIESLWDRRVLIQSAWVGTGRPGGDLWVASLASLSGIEKLANRFLRPLYRKWIKRK